MVTWGRRGASRTCSFWGTTEVKGQVWASSVRGLLSPPWKGGGRWAEAQLRDLGYRCPSKPGTWHGLPGARTGGRFSLNTGPCSQSSRRGDPVSTGNSLPGRLEEGKEEAVGSPCGAPGHPGLVFLTQGVGVVIAPPP